MKFSEFMEHFDLENDSTQEFEIVVSNNSGNEFNVKGLEYDYIEKKVRVELGDLVNEDE